MCNLSDDTFRVFVKVCDINAFIRANSLCADEVAHCLFLTVDLSEGPICVLLPVDFITINLGEQETEQVLKLSSEQMGNVTHLLRYAIWLIISTQCTHTLCQQKAATEGSVVHSSVGKNCVLEHPFSTSRPWPTGGPQSTIHGMRRQLNC